ncbi:MAG: EGF-like domain-containing protein [Bacteroidetes bacterium]|nr:EGF-like domain-containing protein [Bacteroidota bacterium]
MKKLIYILSLLFLNVTLFVAGCKKVADCGEHGHSDKGNCVCDSLWSGVHCETISACAKINCGAHGHCVDGVCVCDTNWGGEHCNIAYDRCLVINLNCGNHGHCVDGNCVCDSGWTGTYCEAPTTDNLAGNYHMYGYRTYWGSYLAPTDTIDAVVAITKTNDLILRIYGNDLVYTTTAVGADPAHGYTYFCNSCSNGDDMSRLVFPKPFSDTVIFTNSGGPASGGYNTNLTGIKLH